VRNDADGATIEVEGASHRVAAFQAALPVSLPPLARLSGLSVSALDPPDEPAFTVTPSATNRRRRAMIPPDAALCDDCRRDMDDAGDRRHQYAFTTCTNCGPRFSIARSLPYDRERTSMAAFALCARCREEYESVTDRRFHAEPVCCPRCGPTLWLTRGDGRRLGTHHEALRLARRALAAGKIVAVKGLGGFQLACLADAAGAVARLRQRKGRSGKPFAIMVRDLAAARRRGRITPEDERLMTSPAGPIALVPARGMPAPAASGVADVGLMLPTTPLHVELFRGAPYDALVMTSGNRSDEPIACDNDTALRDLRGIADLFLMHDRDVVHRVDDSVVRSVGPGHVMVRRSRGWVPRPVSLPFDTSEPVLAVGAFLQNTACIAHGDEAFLTQHVGDLDNERARGFLGEVVEDMEAFLDVRPQLVVADLHPDYPSMWLGEYLARSRDGTFLQVQHHLAHAAGVLAEHGRFPEPGETAGAIILDGTGYGMDGTAWGCELLCLDGELRWSRPATATALRLVGGERAIRGPWRVAVAALEAEGGANLLSPSSIGRFIEDLLLMQVATLAAHDRWPLATGAGRVFEAAGALLGCCMINDWEGEAAARCEALASRCTEPVEPWDDVGLPDDRDELPTAALLVALARRVAGGEAPERVALGFHVSFCKLLAELAGRVFATRTRTIALGGGCLVNRLIQERLSSALRERGFDVMTPEALPPGDGGISYGQAVLAAAAVTRARTITYEGDGRCASQSPCS